MRKGTGAARGMPTEAEIRQYDNVPVGVAARYLGMGANSLYYALQDGRAPFGFSVERDSEATYTGRTYTYHISPGLLIAYKNGQMQCTRSSDVVRVLRDAAEELAYILSGQNHPGGGDAN